jgi:AAA family ATP:ADP antiporter
MTSLWRVIGQRVALRKGEVATAGLMFAYSFLAMTSYNILKPITRSKFITSLGADNLPYVQLAAGIVIGVLMHLYSRGMRRLPRRWVIPVTQTGQAALLVLFWFLFQTTAEWVSVAFYVFGLVLGILLISQFWTLANDIYDPRQAKRLFGLVGGGASLGGAAGAVVTSFTVETVGTNNLLLASAALLGVCAILVTAISGRVDMQTDPATAADTEGVESGEILRLLRTSKHLRIIALVIGFAAFGAVIIEQQLNMAAEAIKGPGEIDAITGFLARVTFYLSLIGFIIQVTLTSRIHRNLGLGVALLLLPVSLGASAVVILLNGALWVPAAARVLDTSLRYTIDKTTREVLFLPLAADVKYRAKPVVDVTVDRFARALGALVLLVLIKPWGLSLEWQQLSYASLVVAGLWIAMAIRARREYLSAFRRSIEARTMAPASVRLDLADTSTIEALVEEMADPDESRVLYAIDMLDALDKRNLVTPLLLHHESPNVRARALQALESADPSMAARWAPVVERMLKDQNAAVRTAAVRALAALSGENASTVMRRYLNDADSRVVVTAAAVLADSALDTDVDAAETTLGQLTGDSSEAAAASRRQVAAALGRVRNPRFRPLLVSLMSDGDLDVAREALRSVQTMTPIDPLFVPRLVALLGHRVLKAHAREVLVRGGEEVVDVLAHFLRDQEENVWVRRHIPATLALVPVSTTRSLDILLGALNDPDGFLRYKVVTAIEKLRSDNPGIVVPQRVVEPLILGECTRYYDHLTLRSNILRHDQPASTSLLVRALNDKLERTLDRIFRLLGLIYPRMDVLAARRAIEGRETRTRAGAIEYLDNLLKGEIRRRVMPILEDTPLDEKVRHANTILRTRPRDLEDTLAQLVHDEDQVVAASAIHFVEQRKQWSLADDLEYELTRRSPNDWYVFEAASWVLGGRRLSAATRREMWMEPLPAVELADRACRIPLFDFISVDELFRIAGAARQVRHEPGQILYTEGTASGDVQFVLDGTVEASVVEGVPCRIEAPVALAFEEMLQGRAVRRTIRAVDRVVCLAVARDEFLTMFSDNIVLAQGLFRMLLDASKGLRSRASYYPLRSAEAGAGSKRPLAALEKVLLLRQNPLLRRATVSQLLDLSRIAHEIPLTEGRLLFSPTDPPAMYHLLEGEIRLEDDVAPPVLASGACIVGVAETLAGVTTGWRATVTRSGHALRLDHQELFEVLADHVDLLQSLFSGVLSTTRAEVPGEPTLLRRL